MTIHHATQKKAQAAGLEIRPYQEGFGVYYFKDGRDEVGTLATSATDPKEALNLALEQGYGVQTKAPTPTKNSAPAVSEADTEDNESEHDEDEEEGQGGSIVKQRYKLEYAARGDVTCCGDDLSQVLKEAVTEYSQDSKKSRIDMPALREIAKQSGLEAKFDEYEQRLNPGMVRMNIGNLLRKKMRDEGHVMVGNRRVEDPDWEEADDS